MASRLNTFPRVDLTDEEVMTALVDPRMTFAIVLVVGFGLVLLVWLIYTSQPRVTRLSTRSFWCPFRRQNVVAEFLEEAWDGTPVAVESCDAFSPPRAVACDRLCLRLTKLPPFKTHWAA
jgi:hypothetical protein